MSKSINVLKTRKTKFCKKYYFNLFFCAIKPQLTVTSDQRPPVYSDHILGLVFNVYSIKTICQQQPQFWGPKGGRSCPALLQFISRCFFLYNESNFICVGIEFIIDNVRFFQQKCEVCIECLVANFVNEKVLLASKCIPVLIKQPQQQQAFWLSLSLVFGFT